MTDLSNVSSTELIKELENRGFWTSFMYDTSDVQIAVNFVLSEDDKLEIINNCFEDNSCLDIDKVFIELNTAIDNYILNEYDNKHYYQTKENTKL